MVVVSLLFELSFTQPEIYFSRVIGCCCTFVYHALLSAINIKGTTCLNSTVTLVCFFLSNLFVKPFMGLYRDDGLFILLKINKQQTDRVQTKIISIFKNIDFKIEIDTNLTEVDILDVTFNLENNTYRPYKKSNYKLIYIDISSNHPPQIKKQLTKIISDRLSRSSSNADIFNNIKLRYEEAMKKCGYTRKLTYTPPNREQNNVRRKRQRKIIWLNPPFNLDLSTNVAKMILNLIEKHVPRSSKLREIFNKNTVKVSYSCTQNI